MAADSSPPSVWIVDDSPLDCQRAERALAGDCHVEVFVDGSAALERIGRDGPPDAIVLDWVMPGVSGIEVIQFLRGGRGRDATVPILLLTAQQRPEQIIEGLNAGANDYLPKPYAIEELRARVDALLRSAALLRRARDAERAVRELLAASPNALLAINDDGVITFANIEAARVLGVSEASLAGQPLSAVLPSLSLGRRDAPVADIQIGDRAYAPSVRVLAGSLGTVVTLHDVTERRRLEARRLDLYSIVAHDLRSPLGAMMLRSQNLLDGLGGELPLQARGDIERIVKSCGGMVAIINDFLALAQLDSAPIIEREAVDLSDVIVGVLDELTPLASARKVILAFQRPVTPLAVIGERARLGQVVANLVGNAIKFAPAATTVDISGAASGDVVEVAVQDAGPGVPPAAIATLFDRFTRAESTGAVAGTGLGLVIVRQIVGAHGGEVGVDSAPGRGSRFWFRLPRHPGERSPAVAAS